ncbi:hypothetical protein A5652_20290 [Mycobacterium sp. 1165178.9]|nr:hypothetical protein A5652_20290 [Mycobacterium sp. 1165178.9]
MLIGWDFDSRVTFERGAKTLPGPNQLGAFLYWMLWKRSGLDIHLLKSNLRLLPAFDGIWFGPGSVFAPRSNVTRESKSQPISMIRWRARSIAALTCLK